MVVIRVTDGDNRYSITSLNNKYSSWSNIIRTDFIPNNEACLDINFTSMWMLSYTFIDIILTEV